jgi:hypothetical protein
MLRRTGRPEIERGSQDEADPIYLCRPNANSGGSRRTAPVSGAAVSWNGAVPTSVDRASNADRDPG